MIVSLEKEYNRAFKLGLKALREGKLVVFPTDTVYGIGGDATDPKVIEAIYRAKERERGKPLAVVMSGMEMIMEWCEVSNEGFRAMMENFPGPYTFIVKLKKGKELAGQKEKIGIRIPNHFFLRKLVLDFKKPIIATSANLSGNKDPVRIEEVESKLIKAAAVAIDCGETQHKKSSTIVDLVERKILRKGAGEFKF